MQSVKKLVGFSMPKVWSSLFSTVVPLCFSHCSYTELYCRLPLALRKQPAVISHRVRRDLYHGRTLLFRA